MVDTMNRTVLIVDDSLTVRMDLSEAFEGAGIASVACGSLAEARELLRDPSIGLAVLDVVLPDGDGVSLLRELREHENTRSMPVLMDWSSMSTWPATVCRW